MFTNSQGYARRYCKYFIRGISFHPYNRPMESYTHFTDSKICVVASPAPPMETWPATKVCTLDWESNWW